MRFVRFLPNLRWAFFGLIYMLGCTAVFGRTREITEQSADNNQCAVDGFPDGGTRCEMARR